MTVLLRFADLIESGIVNSWPQLKRLQKLHGFPLGKMLSPNIRAWTEAEVDEWIASRPVENVQPLKGGAKTRREQALAKREEASATSERQNAGPSQAGVRILDRGRRGGDGGSGEAPEGVGARAAAKS